MIQSNSVQLSTFVSWLITDRNPEHCNYWLSRGIVMLLLQLMLHMLIQMLQQLICMSFTCMQRTTADQDSKPSAAAAPTPVSSPGVTPDSTATTTTLPSESFEPKLKKNADRGSRKRQAATGSASSSGMPPPARPNCGDRTVVAVQMWESSTSVLHSNQDCAGLRFLRVMCLMVAESFSCCLRKGLS